MPGKSNSVKSTENYISQAHRALPLRQKVSRPPAGLSVRHVPSMQLTQYLAMRKAGGHGTCPLSRQGGHNFLRGPRPAPMRSRSRLAEDFDLPERPEGRSRGFSRRSNSQPTSRAGSLDRQSRGGKRSISSVSG